ncbi:MAG TPA: SRPBCC family protein [Pyrinomonadaceae bacterium]|nr:SRPBCC family protein [Pyrinomonadaceae bacterium]
MAEHVFKRELTIDLPRAEVFGFFADAANLERITPAELSFHISTPQPIEMREGTLIDYRMRLNGLPMSWRTLISKWDPPNEFIDEQLSGPYKQWIHRHTFTALGPDKTLIEDEVRYRLPFEPFGDLAHFLVEGQLRKIFDHRQKFVVEHFRDTSSRRA